MAPTIAKPLLSDLVAQTGQVPPSHVRPVGDRPDLASVDHESGAGIPLIDLKHLDDDDGPERRKVVEAIGRACESDGFFMVTNHGIPLAYRPFTYQEYYDEFWNMGLHSASCLDRFRPAAK